MSHLIQWTNAGMTIVVSTPDSPSFLMKLSDENKLSIMKQAFEEGYEIVQAKDCLYETADSTAAL